jgi:hypothetical protein
MIQLVYVSSATVPFSEADLVELLTRSRENNTKLGVTGMLLFKDGNFMQVLEGDEQDVMPLFARVSLDTRHRGVLMLLKNLVSKKDFADWSMAFMDLRKTDLTAYPGYSEFLNTPLTDQSLTKDESKVKKLLSVFRTSMR